MVSVKKNLKIYSKSKYWLCKYIRNNNLLGKLYVCYLKDKVCLFNLKGEKFKGGENYELLKIFFICFIFRKW